MKQAFFKDPTAGVQPVMILVQFCAEDGVTEVARMVCPKYDPPPSRIFSLGKDCFELVPNEKVIRLMQVHHGKPTQDPDLVYRRTTCKFMEYDADAVRIEYRDVTGAKIIHRERALLTVPPPRTIVKGASRCFELVPDAQPLGEEPGMAEFDVAYRETTMYALPYANDGTL